MVYQLPPPPPPTPPPENPPPPDEKPPPETDDLEFYIFLIFSQYIALFNTQFCLILNIKIILKD